MEPSANTSRAFPVGGNNGAHGVLGETVAGAHCIVNRAAKAAAAAMANVEPAIGRVAERAHQAVDTAAGSVPSTSEWPNLQGGNIQASRAKLFGLARGRVSANPVATVAIGLAAGVLSGRLAH